MKHSRRRRHLRPRATRSQIRQHVGRLSHRIQLCRTEWLMEAARPDRNLLHLRLLHDHIVKCLDASDNLESYA